MDRQTLRCYKRAMRKNKNVFFTVADCVTWAILVYVIASLIFREIGFVRHTAAYLAFCACMLYLVLYMLAGRIRLEKFMKKERRRILHDDVRRTFLLMSDDEFEAKVASLAHDDSHLIALHNSKETDADCILKAYREAKGMGKNSVTLVSLSPLTKDACDMAENIADAKIRIISQDEIVAVGVDEKKHTDEYADRLFLREYETLHPKKTLKSFLQNRRGAYPLCGVILLILSFFLKYSMYYRLLAVFCFYMTFWGAVFRNKNNLTSDEK
ncbi:MAG: hypothetical protein IJO93_02270 [Clostridia bacterium]|nr:hypothetical protein [Clostridia bacterium]